MHPPPPPGFRPERLPLLLLLAALSTLFLRSVDKGYFYSPSLHDGDSGVYLTTAENLSPDHNFRLFLERRQGSVGAPAYLMYSRFPVGGYALIKLVMLPFGSDLSARILAARMLMLLFFSAAVVLAFLALARITSHPWIALAATLPAFSSWYMLFFSDMVSTEGSVDLFAVMLVFHGMVVFVQEGRFRQLLARTGAALLLGWHVYAFLLPFLILGTACEAVRAWKGGAAPWPRVRSTAAAVLRSRYTALGLAALLFGLAVLTFNFANEYLAYEGRRAVTELPSFRSMMRRTGVAGVDLDFGSLGAWLNFLQRQFFRLGVASVPSVLSDWGVGSLQSFLSIRASGPALSGPAVLVLILALLLVVGASAAILLASPPLAPRQRLLLAVLALSGFSWALLMRHNVAGHLQEAMYYVGVPLVFYSLLLLYVHKRWGRRPVVGLAAAALLAFVVSAFRMDHTWGPDARAAAAQKAALAELGAIRETTRGKVVLVLDSVKPEWFRQLLPVHVWRYYLAGSVLMQSRDPEAAARAADFIVARDRVESDALLTSGNEHVFLYDPAGIDDLLGLYQAAYQQAVSGDPAARSWLDVYLGDDTVTFVRDPCVREDARVRVLVSVTPEDPKELPRTRPGYGSKDLEVNIHKRPVWFDGKCIAVFSLPGYPISGVRGQGIDLTRSHHGTTAGK